MSNIDKIQTGDQTTYLQDGKIFVSFPRRDNYDISEACTKVEVMQTNENYTPKESAAAKNSSGTRVDDFEDIGWN